MKPIITVEGIEIPQIIRETLSALPYEEQLQHFTLTKEWDRFEEVTLNKSDILNISEHEDVEAILVCDGVVVGVNVSLHDIYFSYTSSVSTEFFYKASGKVHCLEQRHGGEYYKDYANARYTFVCKLL